MQVVLVEIDAVLRSTGAAATIFLSDKGYISLSTDPGGPTCYVPYLTQPLNDESEMPISPESEVTVSQNWGDIVFVNPRNLDGTGSFNGVIDTLALAGRKVKVLVGEKTFDPVRGIWVDPALSTFVSAFQGVALGWEAEADQVSVSIRDNLSVLDLPIQDVFYGGTGGKDGTADLVGVPIPKLRGSCQNIQPVIVDPVKFTYQVSDASISTLVIYEGGGGSFTFNADFASYAGMAAATLTSGQYATCLVQGFFRLGRAPVANITCDAIGNFAAGSTSFTPFNLALFLLTQEAGYTGFIDSSSFSTLDAANSFSSGIYTGTDAPTTNDLLDELLRGIGGAVGTDLSGNAHAFQLKAPSGSPAFTWNTAHIMDCQPADLPDSVVEPNWRRTLGYSRNYTVGTDNLLGSVTGARLSFLGREYAPVVFSDTSVQTRYPTAQDVPMVKSQLLLKANAQTAVNAMGTLWGTQRYLYDLTLPRGMLSSLQNIGTIGMVTYPCGKLAAGALCVVVGHSRDLQSDRVIQRILV